MHLTPPPPTTPSFAKSAIPLHLSLKPSRVYVLCIVLIHLLAVVATFISAIPLLIKLIICAVVTFSLVYNIKDALTQQRLIWRAGNHWIIDNDPQPSARAQLTAIDFLSRWLVIITLKEDRKRKQRYVIPFDAVTADSYRLLRVRLRIEGHGLLNPEDSPL